VIQLWISGRATCVVKFTPAVGLITALIEDPDPRDLVPLLVEDE
jgi:hypothetical protein